jgi:hypothetical protein
MQPQAFRVRGFHPLWPAFPGPFRYACGFSLHGASPRRIPTTPRTRGHAVWAPPRSLAATGGISFDFYSRWYLDGSLPSVSPVQAIDSPARACHPDIRVTPFGNPRIFGYWPLPAAYRSLSRPSSPGSS